MEEKSKTSKITCIVLAILLVISLGFICYDKLINKAEPVKCRTEENVTANSFQVFSANLKNKITNWKLNSNYFLAEDTYWTAYDNNEKYNVRYKVVLTNKMQLKLIFDKGTPVDSSLQDKYANKYGEMTIADNVISFAIVQHDAGGYKNIYFINENGTIGVAEPYDMLNSDKSKLPITNPLPGYKNIVTFVQGTFDGNGLTQDPYAIDINGNAFEIQGAWD